MTFADAMNKYGSDKPDTRFDMQIQDITETVKDIDFVLFKSAIENGGSVRAIVAKGGAETYTRKEIDKLVEHAKGIGAKGLAYIRWADEPNCSFKKFLGEGDLENILSAVGAEKGDLRRVGNESCVFFICRIILTLHDVVRVFFCKIFAHDHILHIIS